MKNTNELKTIILNSNHAQSPKMRSRSMFRQQLSVLLICLLTSDAGFPMQIQNDQ